jgi:hypothetical protein
MIRETAIKGLQDQTLFAANISVGWDAVAKKEDIWQVTDMEIAKLSPMYKSNLAEIVGTHLKFSKDDVPVTTDDSFWAAPKPKAVVPAPPVSPLVEDEPEEIV